MFRSRSFSSCVLLFVLTLLGTSVLCDVSSAADDKRKKEAPKAENSDAEKDKKSEGDAESGEKGEASKKDAKEEAKPSVVTRPLMSDAGAKAGPLQEEVEVNDEGYVSFNLKGQPWEAVLQWLADSSKLSFDWGELPGDTLNLTTTRRYSLAEARDIINRHLLARGYSLVLNGEFLSVMKLGDLKPSLIPRVAPEDLEKQMDHTLCKVSFDLNWLIADEAVTELEPMLTAAGKINKLSRTNRLEVIDTAASLRDIYQILQDEQSDTGQEQLVKTFRLEHRRAGEVIVLLRELLGIDPPPGGGGAGGSSRDIGQIANVMKQMTQQLQRMGNNAAKGGSGGREPTKTRLVLNPRENMILVQAMPDQMALIDKAIQQIDVPIDESGSLLQNMNRMQVYRLETVNPQTLVDLLQELGDMAPGTVLKVDSDKKAIMAYASLADHLTIRTLVERLDQSGRSVQVVTLRRLEADYVAGTIRALMLPPKKEQSNSRYSFFSRYSSNQSNQDESDQFKVEADIENNRLLIYANKVEMDEIYVLLQKLGEIPNPDAADSGIRVFELSPGEDAHDVIERIRMLWHRKNEIRNNLPPKQKEDAGEDDPEGEAADPKAKPQKVSDNVTSRSKGQPTDVIADSNARRALSAEDFFRFAEQPSVAATVAQRQQYAAQSGPTEVSDARLTTRSILTYFPEDPPAGDAPPPVQFSLTPDGQLIVSCDDPEALLELEDMLREVMQPAPKYKVFNLKYATPSWVTLNLEDYFKAEEETESSMTYDWYWGYRPSTKKKSGSPSLGRRRQPTFIYDNFTSTILVRDADRRQLKIIQDLINVYDVPEPADTRAMRVTKLFKLRNAKAANVAQAVKDVFRDLLSSNDRALEKKEGQQSQTRVYSYFRGGQDDGGDDDSPIRFKGLLSVGVEPNSDTLVVSSTAALMDTISELILELDKAGETSAALQVVKLDSSVDVQLIQERLSKALGTTTQESQQKKAKEGRRKPKGVPVGAQLDDDDD